MTGGLLSWPMPAHVHVAATRDIRVLPSGGGSNWTSSFNAGVLLIRPNAAFHKQLLSALYADTIAYDHLMSEQVCHLPPSPTASLCACI